MGFWSKLLGKESNVIEPPGNPVGKEIPIVEERAAPPVRSQDPVSKGRETWKNNLESDHPERINELLHERGNSAPLQLSMAIECEKKEDFLGARRYYMAAVESITQFNTLSNNSVEQEVESFKKAYFNFVVYRDPLYKNILNQILPIVKNNPGILQTELYEKTPLEKSDIGYCLYFAAEAGVIKRDKKGRTYQLTVSDTSH